MKIPSDTTLWEMVEKYNLNLEAPTDGCNIWTILNEDMSCISYNKSLKVALLEVYAKLNQNGVETN